MNPIDWWLAGVGFAALTALLVMVMLSKEERL